MSIDGWRVLLLILSEQEISMLSIQIGKYTPDRPIDFDQGWWNYCFSLLLNER